MALSPTEESLVRQLIAQNPALLNLASSESTIISKLGATKVSLSDLSAATSLSDADLALVRQGLNDKSFAMSVLSDYVNGKLPAASEAVAGVVELATTAEAQALLNDANALTPKKLADAFKGANRSLSLNGYQKLPGGLIIQWGTSNNASVNPLTVTLPVAFPNQGLVAVASDLSGSFTPVTAVAICSARFLSNSQIQTATASAVSTLAPDSLQWLAIGY